MNDFDPALLNIFATEQQEHIQRMRAAVDRLPSGEPRLFDALLHPAHTLKGAARAVGLDATETMVHLFETVCLRLRDRPGAPSSDETKTLQSALDYAEDVLAWALGQRGRPDEDAILRELDRLGKGSGGSEPSPTLLSPAPPETTASQVRVGTSVLDAVARISAQLVTQSAEQTAQADRLNQYAESTNEVIREYERLRRSASNYLTHHRDDPELAPLAACIRYLDEHRAGLAAGARNAAAIQRQSAWNLERQAEELREHISEAQMLPAESAFGSFGAMVRALAETEGKRIEFRAEGLDVRADRQVFQALKEPVMHLLRNAVSHGIEAPDVRSRSGKPESGAVTLRVSSAANRLRIAVADDGRGLDTGRIANEALNRGFVSAAALPGMSEADKLQLVFHAGISTAESPSRIAGRGMGMAIVQESVSRLHGYVTARTQADSGTVIELTAPLAISTQRVLLVQQGAHLVAVSLAQVESVTRRGVGEIVVVKGRECVPWDGGPIPLVPLSDLLQLADSSVGRARILQLLIVKDGPRRLAVSVEQILELREAHARDTGLPQDLAGWSTGAIPLEDGRVAVFLNLAEPLRQLSRLEAPTRFQSVAAELPKPRILVVDDSVTTRSVERSILEAHNYQVELAVDGLDGWERVQKSLPELVISDVAMPRMTGFELLEKIKANPATQAIPVILVTSLEDPADQQRGLSLGADAYLLKRKFDQRDLLDTIRQIL